MTWEGRSCNGHFIEGLDRGATIYGTGGSALLDGNNVTLFDKKNTVIKAAEKQRAGRRRHQYTKQHRHGPGSVTLSEFCGCHPHHCEPNCTADTGHKSTLLLHLGNIAWRVGRELNCDTATGHILNDAEAMKMWRRTYEKGWEPKV